MKKIAGLTIFFLFFSFVSVVFAAESVDEPLSLLEKVVYGSPQAGPILPRLNKLERDVFGRVMPGSIKDREKNLMNFLIYGTDRDLPLTVKVDAVEWTVFGRINQGGLLSRVEQLENRIMGKSGGNSLAMRVIELLKVSLPDSKIVIKSVDIPLSTLVKVSIGRAISSKTARIGDKVPYVVCEDVIVNGVLVVPNGTPGAGEVIKVEKAGNFGRSGTLSINFGAVSTIMGDKLPLGVGKKSVSENEKGKNTAFAIGSSIVGAAVLGPIGLVAGIFVHGKDIVVPGGAKFYVETMRKVSTKGLLVGEGGIKKGGGKE